MDCINESPLNKAHYWSRRADRLADRGRLDEACSCHLQAAALLVEALTLTANPLALESIELQRQYHVKKQHIIRLRKQQYLAIEEAARVQKEVMSRVLKVSKKTGSAEADASLQKAIFRTFEETDSLLELLVHKKEGVATDAAPAESVQPGTTARKPKDDSVVIEELKIVNYQLRNLISQLMAQLAASEKQVAVLNKRIAELEAGADADAKADVDADSTSYAEELVVDLPPLDLPHFEESRT